jgi:DNA-binding PucR family transcriptional regulator
MAFPSTWDPPSDAAAAIIREATAKLVEEPGGLLKEINEAVFDSLGDAVRGEPALAAAIERSNRANLMGWAMANLRNPGMPVPPNVGPEVLDVARDVVRRGLDDTSVNAYRVGQNIAWRHFIAAAFSVSDDVEALQEALDIVAQSSAAFVDGTIGAIYVQIEREREQLLSGVQAERLEVVSLILDGAPITAARASARLRYELQRPHTAYVVWSDDESPDQGQLERVAESLADAALARRPFTVAATVSSLWAWFSGVDEFDVEALRAAVPPDAGVRVALGTTNAGIEGFRRGHLDARETQQLMLRGPDHLRFASHQEVQVAALMTADADRAQAFVARTLGDLATADPQLLETLRTYLRQGSSAARTARALYTHRNTVINRLSRAEELLPAPLAGRNLEVGLALEIVHWLGPRGSAAGT